MFRSGQSEQGKKLIELGQKWRTTRVALGKLDTKKVRGRGGGGKEASHAGASSRITIHQMPSKLTRYNEFLGHRYLRRYG
jgi:hypothetical protein